MSAEIIAENCAGVLPTGSIPNLVNCSAIFGSLIACATSNAMRFGHQSPALRHLQKLGKAIRHQGPLDAQKMFSESGQGGAGATREGGPVPPAPRRKG